MTQLRMEDEFKTLLLAGCPFALLKWMRAQELQPLLRLVKRPKFLAAENSEMPGLFYLAYHLGLGRNYKVSGRRRRLETQLSPSFPLSLCFP